MKLSATLLLLLALSVMAWSQNWRVLQNSELIALSGTQLDPRFRAGTAVCSAGIVPASYDPVRKSFRTAGCPPLVVFSGGFE